MSATYREPMLPGMSDIPAKNPISDEDIHDEIQPCHDCEPRHFIKEAFYWAKNTFWDVWGFISQSKTAKTVLLIGFSALLVAIVGSNPIAALLLEATGLGRGRVILRLIATVVEELTGHDWVAPIASQLLTAIRDGATVQSLVTFVLGSLGVIGAIEGKKLMKDALESYLESHSRQSGWRSWEAQSQVKYSSDLKFESTNSWGTLDGKRCVAYGYREYHAPIRVGSDGMSHMSACLRTPNVIHSTRFKAPFKCEDKGSYGVVGVWYVQSNAYPCMPHCEDFRDEGCIQRGRKRMFARLHGLNPEDDWYNMCESAPAIINGIHYDRPTYCDTKGKVGIYGAFDIHDSSCGR
ncbi:hypothetical protein BDV93DRAFT_563998 [Ceratobasidium sp. AG-I]|nr:hypothetical protein BDV93DRAFT_563998 [Ceratobasidium sp. AG-I]